MHVHVGLCTNDQNVFPGECGTNNGGCDHICVYTAASQETSCLCPFGYIRETDDTCSKRKFFIPPV